MSALKIFWTNLLSIFSSVDFWSNFLANFLADLIIAVGVLIAITRPIEKKEEKEHLRQSIGLLKAEFETNASRAKIYQTFLKGNSTELKKISSLRYTRGVWNALKESGFIPKLKNTKLVYHLLRVNEAIVIADASLHKVILAVRDKKPTTNLVKVALKDTTRLLNTLNPLLEIFNTMNLPIYQPNNLFEEDK